MAITKPSSVSGRRVQGKMLSRVTPNPEETDLALCAAPRDMMGA